MAVLENQLEQTSDDVIMVGWIFDVSSGSSNTRLTIAMHRVYMHLMIDEECHARRNVCTWKGGHERPSQPVLLG